MNNQEVFNKVWEYFIINNNPKGISKTGFCVYFDLKTGKKCAIGCLLPEEKMIAAKKIVGDVIDIM